MANITSAELRQAGRVIVGNRVVRETPKPHRRKAGTGKFAMRKRWELEQMRGPGVFLPIYCRSEANNRDDRWSKAGRTKDFRWLACLQVHAKFGNVMALPAAVTLTRLGPRTLDDDNLRTSLKAVRDGVADAFGCGDDADSGLTFAYGQERHRYYGVRVEVRGAADRAGDR